MVRRDRLPAPVAGRASRFSPSGLSRRWLAGTSENCLRRREGGQAIQGRQGGAIWGLALPVGLFSSLGQISPTQEPDSRWSKRRPPGSRPGRQDARFAVLGFVRAFLGASIRVEKWFLEFSSTCEKERGRACATGNGRSNLMPSSFAFGRRGLAVPRRLQARLFSRFQPVLAMLGAGRFKRLFRAVPKPIRAMLGASIGYEGRDEKWL
jgi:hypothetical protein